MDFRLYLSSLLFLKSNLSFVSANKVFAIEYNNIDFPDDFPPIITLRLGFKYISLLLNLLLEEINFTLSMISLSSLKSGFSSCILTLSSGS